MPKEVKWLDVNYLFPSTNNFELSFAGIKLLSKTQ